ncbi:MAG: leucine-rich repeat domain-containing protein [Cyclobacteriaceae bacterium]|nr:leucine-rich repeat domain-containing protein [Cyclobacteriaceae bacterium]
MRKYSDDTCIMRIKRTLTLFVLLLTLVGSVHAQKSQKKVESPDQDKVKNMISFLEFMLNTLGSSKTSARDKEVLVTESYTKIFRDSKVQIEDDLAAKRDVITNKDVTAYLKDVDFFFTDVKFEFNIEEIQEGKQTDNNIFYKVKLLRNLSGTTVEGETLNNSMLRYVEVNYNQETQDLKIVSIYTNEFDERAALTYWWNQLSYEWQSILKRKLKLVGDSVQVADLKRMTAITEIDVTGNVFIKDIEPLAQLYNLKSLNLSKSKVTDLSPIRNLTELTDLNLSGTKTEDITALRYSSKLTNLSISHTVVTDISVLEKMPELQQLDVSGTNLLSFDALRYARNLQDLNLKASNISDLQSLDSLQNLTTLNLSNTSVVNLRALAALPNLKELKLDSNKLTDISVVKDLTDLTELSANYTLVSDLSSLQGLPNLKRIYCDHTPITRAVAEAFMAANPAVLVIFDSEDLKSWWVTLTPAWRNIFTRVAQISTNPSKEELAKLTKLDSINISNTGITDIEPLARLRQLRKIVLANTTVSDLSPLQPFIDVTYLDISDTQVGDISVINQFKKLTMLRANNTQIKSLNPELLLPNLEVLYADNTGLDDEIIKRFLDTNPGSLIVYKTTKLKQWWAELPDAWKEVFRKQVGAEPVTTETLHKLIAGERLRIESKPITDLHPLDEFIRLTDVYISDTEITDLTPLTKHSGLRSLAASKSPIRNIEALATLDQLETLNLSDTPLEDFRILRGLINLKGLDCSGTLIRKLDDFGDLPMLESLDCSNTAVRKLDPVSNRSLLKLTCYNSKVSAKRVAAFKSSNPDCKVIYYGKSKSLLNII